LQIVKASAAAKIVHGLYPHAVIRVDAAANALIVVASEDDQTAIRTIVAGIDVRNPTAETVEAISLHESKPSDVAKRLRPLFPRAHFAAAPNQTLIVSATAQDAAQIRAVLAALDTAAPLPTPRPVGPTVVIRVTQRNPKAIARAVAGENRAVRVAVSGNEILISGPPDDVNAAKGMVPDLDQPENGVQFTRVYRIHDVGASSLADLLSRSFRGLDVTVDADLNAITVFATSAMQTRVADAIAELDRSDAGTAGGGPSQGFGGGGTESDVVRLHAAVPALGGGASTSAADIAQSVTQSLAQTAPDLHIVVHPNSTKLILTGSRRSIDLAKRLIDQLDVAEPLVELDTEVLEVDEGVQKQLGFKFPTPVLSTTYSEVTPTSTSNTPQFLGLQPITRTPLTLGAELDFLISTNKARILEDPRITTFSGRTASLHAGETVNILTTTGGGSGTIATTQVQSFQTGVSLDITPVVNSDDYVTVTLHPSINSEAGVSSAGVPNIQTRDTTTTVGLHDGETIVVGGLIEDDDSRTISKVPILGDLPLIGRLFQDVGVSHTRNELIVTVTPHIVTAHSAGYTGGLSTLRPPSPEPLPTIDPAATVPAHRDQDNTKSSGTIGIASLDGPPTTAPSPQPSTIGAFSRTNVYTFGAAPENNYADAGQPPQIFFIEARPTVVFDGQSVTILAITTTNVTSLSFGPATSSGVPLTNVGGGKWQATFTFHSAGFSNPMGRVDAMLTATTANGSSSRQSIPLSIVTH
jgi:type II secretory pathway component GspD/PulD (secretin)